MNLTFWGTRGSQACPGPETVRYGGNTSCVEVRTDDGALVILDAGTGIRRLGQTIDPGVRRIDILLTHLHMDHIQGLGFFAPFFTTGHEIHLWGPSSPSFGLFQRLTRYLSPPLFPVRLWDLRGTVTVHDAPFGSFEIPGFHVVADLVSHPAPTLGYRIEADGSSVAYLSDHEPALTVSAWGLDPDWTSGTGLAEDVDVLIHDAQYAPDEYDDHLGWGHSSTEHTLRFAQLVRARQLVPFHHDPGHTDDDLDKLFADMGTVADGMTITPAREGDHIECSPPRRS